jgi:ATP-dependent DNA helicase RecG
VFDQLFPLGQYYSYVFLNSPIGPGVILQVSINKTREITKASDGIAYLRRGAQNLPVTSQEALARLRLDKGISSFEAETIDVSQEIITNSVPILEFLINVIPTAEPEAWLQKQQLLRGGKPTVAGILLFAEEPQATLPKRCGVKIYRYQTSAAEGGRETLAFDPITIEGHLYQQVKNAVTRTTELVEGIQKLGPRGLEAIKYPQETLHEIVTNALLHRDYSIPVDVHIRIFDNRIEVESPGKLPGHVTPANILQEQFARNGAIVRVINKFPDPPNKDVGEGLNTAFAAMRRLRLKPPVIDERENSVIVRIRHEPLASPEEAVMEYLNSHPEIVNRVGREITGITSENSMKNVFYRLRDAGLIEPVPGRAGFAAAWRKAQKNMPEEPAKEEEKQQEDDKLQKLL